MNRRRASSRGSVRRPAPASARWVSASGASPSRALATARRTCVAAEASSGRPRATETSAMARSPSAASSRRSGARLGEFRSRAERQRAAGELGQRRDARIRRARGPIRAQRLQEHDGAPRLKDFRRARGRPSEPQRLRVRQAQLGQRQRARLGRQLGEAPDRFVDAERRLVGERSVGALRRRAQGGAGGQRLRLERSDARRERRDLRRQRADLRRQRADRFAQRAILGDRAFELVGGERQRRGRLGERGRRGGRFGGGAALGAG